MRHCLTVMPILLAGALWSAQPGGVTQIVEDSPRGPHCVGLMIQLSALRLKAGPLPPGRIEIREAKHGSRLNEIMETVVSADRKAVTLRFKRGTGDFGSGNRVEVRISRTAFELAASDLVVALPVDPL